MTPLRLDECCHLVVFQAYEKGVELVLIILLAFPPCLLVPTAGVTLSKLLVFVCLAVLTHLVFSFKFISPNTDNIDFNLNGGFAHFSQDLSLVDCSILQFSLLNFIFYIFLVPKGLNKQIGFRTRPIKSSSANS